MTLAAEAQFHVLAVDDSLLDRKLIERLFKTSSYHVTTMDSGNKALEFLGLVDDGYGTNLTSVASDQHKSSSLRDIPVVIMSSENVPSRINRCLEEGAEDFLLKPVQLSDMNKLMARVLKGKSNGRQQENSIVLTGSSLSSKRKATDEGIPVERKRSRFITNLALV